MLTKVVHLIIVIILCNVLSGLGICYVYFYHNVRSLTMSLLDKTAVATFQLIKLVIEIKVNISTFSHRRRKLDKSPIEESYVRANNCYLVFRRHIQLLILIKLYKKCNICLIGLKIMMVDINYISIVECNYICLLNLYCVAMMIG